MMKRLYNALLLSVFVSTINEQAVPQRHAAVRGKRYVILCCYFLHITILTLMLVITHDTEWL